MSLDERMKLIARGEVGRALAGTELEEVKESGGGLAEQVSDLHEHLHRALTQIGKLTLRVEMLEKAAAQPTVAGDSPAEAEPIRVASPRRKPRGSAS